MAVIDPAARARLRGNIIARCTHICDVWHPATQEILCRDYPCIIYPRAITPDDIETYHVIRGGQYQIYTVIIPIDPALEPVAERLGSSLRIRAARADDPTAAYMQYAASSAPVILPSHIEYTARGV